MKSRPSNPRENSSYFYVKGRTGMRTALHTISYSGSWGQATLSLEATIERAAAIGFDGIMLAAKRPHASLLDMKTDARRSLRAKMQECGIGIECLAAYTNFTADAEHGEIPHREMQVYYVGDLCRLVVDLGGTVVRIFTGLGLNRKRGERVRPPRCGRWGGVGDSESSRSRWTLGSILAVSPGRRRADLSRRLRRLGARTSRR